MLRICYRTALAIFDDFNLYEGSAFGESESTDEVGFLVNSKGYRTAVNDVDAVCEGYGRSSCV